MINLPYWNTIIILEFCLIKFYQNLKEKKSRRIRDELEYLLSYSNTGIGIT